MTTHNSLASLSQKLLKDADALSRSDLATKENAELVVDEAQNLVPVQTGRLRDSIHVEKSSDGYEAVADTSYAAEVEYGSSTRPASHFMHNALNTVMPQILTNTKTKIDEVLK